MLRTLTGAGASFALALATPTSALAIPKVGTHAVVRSVDGPTALTIAIGSRTLPVRLAQTDAPATGECGADRATAALRGFVRRAPRRLHYALGSRGSSLARDPAGRYLVVLAYRGRERWRDLGTDLTRAGWAQFGEPTTLDSLPPAATTFPRGTRFAPDRGDHPLTDRGLVSSCGGYVHLRADAAVPARQEPVWDVDERGIAHAIGPIPLSPVLTPANMLTVRKLAAVVPLEVTRGPFGCLGSVASLGLTVFTGGSQTRCGDATVLGLASMDRTSHMRLSRGGGVGQRVSALRSGYPLLDLDDPAGWLSGSGDRQWAWQTAIGTDEQDDPMVTDIVTYQPPPGPDNG